MLDIPFLNRHSSQLHILFLSRNYRIILKYIRGRPLDGHDRSGHVHFLSFVLLFLCIVLGDVGQGDRKNGQEVSWKYVIELGDLQSPIKWQNDGGP